jgi:hypothetical protein
VSNYEISTDRLVFLLCASAVILAFYHVEVAHIPSGIEYTNPRAEWRAVPRFENPNNQTLERAYLLGL